MKSLVGGVFWLLFVFSLELMYCEGCLNQEREALIAMTSNLKYNLDYYTFEFDTGNALFLYDSSDCCEWKGVECNTTTGRVAKLKLQYSNTGPLNYSHFAIFKDLKTLDLSISYMYNCTRTDQGYFSNKVKINRFTVRPGQF